MTSPTSARRTTGSSANGQADRQRVHDRDPVPPARSASAAWTTTRSTRPSVFPVELQFEPDDGLPGTSVLGRTTNLNTNLQALAVHAYAPEGRPLSFTTQLGFTAFDQEFNNVSSVTRGLISGPVEPGPGLVGPDGPEPLFPERPGPLRPGGGELRRRRHRVGRRPRRAVVGQRRRRPVLRLPQGRARASTSPTWGPWSGGPRRAPQAPRGVRGRRGTRPRSGPSSRSYGTANIDGNIGLDLGGQRGFGDDRAGAGDGVRDRPRPHALRRPRQLRGDRLRQDHRQPDPEPAAPVLDRVRRRDPQRRPAPEQRGRAGPEPDPREHGHGPVDLADELLGQPRRGHRAQRPAVPGDGRRVRERRSGRSASRRARARPRSSGSTTTPSVVQLGDASPDFQMSFFNDISSSPAGSGSRSSATGRAAAT